MQTTTERAKALAHEWHCVRCSEGEYELPGGHRNRMSDVRTEIAAILDVLVEARKGLEHEDDCATNNYCKCDCAVAPLVAKIDAILEGN